ncbi:hypothetical protein GSI_07788 [Ganoderma sinense ZZ0214-1]|uniref:Uncharacterized protein n=1 Tax=Ganoderma sinense ZZ0214-1 TaxID=1077348 RepID=A0A2G8S8G9_9APHY|nr:hypothetical protein GSI_07646 [Ganoderma sinense ZZ0214-1]PIL30210.1 hypothetical protein GSI_07788 [Ganoderma sinense ZZ0214-1]
MDKLEEAVVEKIERKDGRWAGGGWCNTARHRGLWTSFVSFLYDSCIAAAKKATALAKAKGCPTPRHCTRAAVYEAQFVFDAFRSKTVCERAELSRAGALDGAARERLGRNAADYRSGVAQSFQQFEQENCRAKVVALERECTSKLEE